MTSIDQQGDADKAREILERALAEIKALGFVPCIRDGAYEPDGSPIEIDNVDFDSA